MVELKRAFYAELKHGKFDRIAYDWLDEFYLRGLGRYFRRKPWAWIEHVLPRIKSYIRLFWRPEELLRDEWVTFNVFLKRLKVAIGDKR